MQFRRRVCTLKVYSTLKTMPRRETVAGHDVFCFSSVRPIRSGLTSGGLWLTALSWELQRIAIRMPKSNDFFGVWVAVAVPCGLQQKDGGRRSLFAVSSCRNRKYREGYRCLLAGLYAFSASKPRW